MSKSKEEKLRSGRFIKLSNVRDLTKTPISRATVGVRRPTSTTFVDIVKGYNAVVYTKTKFQEETGQNGETTPAPPPRRREGAPLGLLLQGGAP